MQPRHINNNTKILEVLGDNRGRFAKDKNAQFKPQWQNLPTIAIRIPEIFAERLKDLARKWDVHGINEQFNNNELAEKIKVIIDKIENHERGYKANGASALIKDVKLLKECLK